MGNPQDPTFAKSMLFWLMPVHCRKLFMLIQFYQRYYVRRRWPDQTGTCFQPYKKIRNELSIEGDCFLRCTIVVVPLKLRDKVLNKLHKGHCEIVRMKKASSRSYVWWPGLDDDISKVVKGCAGCQSVHIVYQQKHHFIHGLGLQLHGRESMWIS